MMIPVPDYIRAIAPYVPGKPVDELAREMGLDPTKIVKLASNENPLGPSPKVKAAIAAQLDDITRYPDGAGFALKAKIAQKFGVDALSVVLGNGSNDILELTTLAYLPSSASAVYAQHSFAVYMLAAQARGAKHICVPAKNFGADLDAMLAAITPDTRILFLANPNNPTGTMLAASEIEQFIEKTSQIAPQVLIVLDEAYTEYLTPAQRGDALALVKKFPNLMVSRTLSKAYGLAALRVGFAVCSPEVAGMLNRVRQPFNVNSLAQAAAIAALDDDDYLRRSKVANDEGRAQFLEGFAAMKIPSIPSFGNFICAEVAVNGKSAGEINTELLKRGVIVRPVGNYGLPKHLRISIGTQAENAAFLSALSAILA
jgi:histidinol-phosphate aminotransferase